MQFRNDKVEGTSRFESDTEFAGMVTGALIAGARTNVHLTGTADSLVVEPGARVIVRGMVTGTVINEGGYVEIHGTVGSIGGADNGATRVFPGSVVGGVRQ